MLTPPLTVVARTCFASGFASGLLLFAGCAGLVPEVTTPAADPSAGATTVLPRSVLGTDEVTRRTQQLLAASGATRLEGLKPMRHNMSMEGMDHGGMKGTTSMPGADHSTMPNMQRQPRTGAPAGKHPHEGMKGMEHPGMDGMDHSKMPEMQKQPRSGAPAEKQQPKGMEGRDHSGMHGMDHSKMPGTKKPPRPGAPEKPQPKAMEGVDHSKMHGPEHGSEAPKRAQPEQSTGTSTDHGAHSNHGGKHAPPASRP